MLDIIAQLPVWVAGPLSGGFLFVVIKYFGPIFKGSLTGQASQWRSESKYIAQLSAERDKLVQEVERERAARRESEDREDKLIRELSSIEAKLEIMTYRHETAERKVGELTAKLEKMKERG